jgi:uncharacterized membrane protein YkoI
MKKNSYLVKGMLGLSLISVVALANDIETNDNKKELDIKSSIQIKDDLSENVENSYAKIDVSDVCKIIKKQETGKIINVDLENQDGNLVYKAEVIKDNKSMNFIIDAGNGKILYKEVDKPDNNQDKEDGEESKD